jgi:hypothetical protein
MTRTPVERLVDVCVTLSEQRSLRPAPYRPCPGEPCSAREAPPRRSCFLYSTGPGKRAIWAKLLDELGLRGDEQVLDVGCGRGAVLMLAARRLPAGRAVGADVWRRRDQSGNSRAAAERNAVAGGVRDRGAFQNGRGFTWTSGPGWLSWMPRLHAAYGP